MCNMSNMSNMCDFLSFFIYVFTNGVFINLCKHFVKQKGIRRCKEYNYKAADGEGVKQLCRDTQCVSTHCAMAQIKHW